MPSFEFITVTRVLARETYLAEAAGTFELSAIGSDAESASKILSAKAGLADPLRPFGVLLFTGPTGVGKTALAKAISDYCFGAGDEKNRLIRLDMSEYSDRFPLPWPGGGS